jgi:hypothetical protein
MSALLLRLCLRAYLLLIREQDGRALLDLACDLSGQDRLGS